MATPKRKKQSGRRCAASACSAIPFENNKGERMQLAPELTIADLVKMGMKQIRIVKAEEPLPDGWWRDCGESPNDQAHSQKGRERGPDSTQD